MRNITQILILQHAYAIAANKLASIGNHPNHVEHGHLGYFMTLDNIKEVIKSFEPNDWYKGEACEGEEVSFQNLPTEDQWEVTEAINSLQEKSMSQNHLVEKCNKCWKVCLEFGDKILELKKEKDTLKKSPV